MSENINIWCMYCTCIVYNVDRKSSIKMCHSNHSNFTWVCCCCPLGRKIRQRNSILHCMRQKYSMRDQFVIQAELTGVLSATRLFEAKHSIRLYKNEKSIWRKQLFFEKFQISFFLVESLNFSLYKRWQCVTAFVINSEVVLTCSFIN